MADFKISPKHYSLLKSVDQKTQGIKTTLELLTSLYNEIGEFTFDRLLDAEEKIAGFEAKMNELQAEYDLKRKTFQVEFDLEVRKDKFEAFQGIAQELSYAVVKADKYIELQEKQQNTEKEIAAAKAIGAASVKNTYVNKEKELEAKYQVDSAELRAENTQLKNTVERLEDEVSRYRDEIREMREANVQNVAAAASKAVNQSFGK